MIDKREMRGDRGTVDFFTNEVATRLSPSIGLASIGASISGGEAEGYVLAP
jgi:hypothetical protein